VHVLAEPDAAGDAAEAADDAVDSAAEAADDAMDSAAEAADDAMDSTAEAVEETGDEAVEAVEDTTEQATDDAAAMTEESADAAAGAEGGAPEALTVDGFDFDKAAEMIDSSEIGDTQKTLLKTGLNQAKDNPELLEAALDKVREALGL